MKSKKITWIVLAAGVVILLGIYLYKVIHYQKVFLPNTEISGFNVSNDDVSSANQKLKQHFDNTNYTVSENEKGILSFTGKEAGVHQDFAKDLNEIKKNQNPWSWPFSYFRSSTSETKTHIQLDNKKFDRFFKKNENLFTNKDRKASKNATLEKQANKFEIVKETYGNTFDTNKVKEAIHDMVANGDKKIDLKKYWHKPTILSTDKKLTDDLAKLNQIHQEKITYNVNGNKEVVPADTIFTWLTYQNGEIGLDNGAITSYVTGLGKKYDTIDSQRTFNSTKRGTVTVPKGTYGWSIQVPSEVSALSRKVLEGKDFSREPIHSGSGYRGDGSDIPNTYIEVDLVNQHMWYYSGGQVVLETDVITGKPSTPTPAGVFYVWNKERNATLVGEDYKTPVDHWMPVDWDGVGIHDSPWQTEYGKNLYETRGSHGCINTPPEVMNTLFNSVEVGIPVVIF